MTLMRMRRAAQLTLPVSVRRALNVNEGDYLEAHVVEGGVLLRPVSVVKRKRAWSGIVRAVSQVRDLRPDKDGAVTPAEDEAVRAVKEFRRANRKHA